MKKTTIALAAITATLLTGCVTDENRDEPCPWYMMPVAFSQGFFEGYMKQYPNQRNNEYIQSEVKPNAYGMGVGMDQYGRAVKVVPAN